MVVSSESLREESVRSEENLLLATVNRSRRRH